MQHLAGCLGCEIAAGQRAVPGGVVHQTRCWIVNHAIGRLNLGPIKTNQIVWDQPHEGNLFEHLYARRAFQRAG